MKNPYYAKKRLHVCGESTRKATVEIEVGHTQRGITYLSKISSRKYSHSNAGKVCQHTHTGGHFFLTHARLFPTLQTESEFLSRL